MHICLLYRLLVHTNVCSFACTYAHVDVFIPTLRSAHIVGLFIDTSPDRKRHAHGHLLPHPDLLKFLKGASFFAHINTSTYTRNLSKYVSDYNTRVFIEGCERKRTSSCAGAASWATSRPCSNSMAGLQLKLPEFRASGRFIHWLVRV